MQIGIFAKIFMRPDVYAIFDAVAQHGLHVVQFNMSCIGLPTLPDTIERLQCDCIRSAAAERGVEIAAMSGTFNLIHPDVEQRAAGLRRLGVLAAACTAMGVSVITLCTGTRDPDNMWRRHPENDSPAAWADLTKAMASALDLAQTYGVTLAIEPELSNVVSSPRLAKKLLAEMRCPHLKVVIDGANLFTHANLDKMPAALQEAVDLLGSDIVLAHAKELGSDGAAGNLAAGAGVLDYKSYLTQLRGAGYAGPLILHSLAESQVAASVAFLRMRLEGLSQPSF